MATEKAKKVDEVKEVKAKKDVMPVVSESDATNRVETVRGIHEGKRPKFGQASF